MTEKTVILRREFRKLYEGMHYVQVGDGQQAGEDVAICSCGAKQKADPALSSWEGHRALMVWANKHKASNTWGASDDD